MFWEDCLAGGRSLRDAYPRLYTNSMQKNLRIEEVRQWISQVGSGNRGGERNRSSGKDLVLRFSLQIYSSLNQRVRMMINGCEKESKNPNIL